MNTILKEFGFSDAEINKFWANAQCVTYHKRQLLLEENQVNRYLYLVKEGIIRSFVTDAKGKTYTKNFFSSLDPHFAVFFPSFLLQEPSLFSIDAVVDSEVWAWHSDYILELIASDVRFINFFRYYLGRLFYQLELKEIRMLRTDREEHYLLFKKERPELINTVPLHYIASYLGITSETLSRIRKRVESLEK